MNSHADGQLIYSQGGKNIQCRKNTLFNKWFWEKWTATWKRITLGHFLILYTKQTQSRLEA